MTVSPHLGTSVCQRSDRPSQVIMGPGSKPSWQEHSKPPTTLVQVPFPHGFPMEHSSASGDEPGRPR